MRGYYSVPQVLDVDRYQVDGRDRDMVLAARELDQNGLPDGQRNWANEHTVYTHGYGVIAAYGNQQDANDKPVTNNDGQPVWAEQDLPPVGRADRHVPERLPAADLLRREAARTTRSSARRPAARDVELDVPQSGSGASAQTNTYDGQGRRRRSAACSTSCCTR